MRSGVWLIIAASALLGGAGPAAPSLVPQMTSLLSGEEIDPVALAKRFEAEERARRGCEAASQANAAKAPGECAPTAVAGIAGGGFAGSLGGFGALAGGIKSARPPTPPTVNAPFIPWPPPRPSSLAEVPLTRLAPVSAAASAAGVRPADGVAPRALRSTAPVRSYGDLDRRLRLSLARRGYATAGYFWTPGGYALVTQLERIGDDGAPIAGAQRWARQKDTAAWTLTDYVTKLFVGDDGRYRMLLIVVGQEPFGMAGYAADRLDADRWQDSGDTALAAQIKGRPVTDQTTISVLVYEFRMGKGQVRALAAERDAPLPAQRHMASLGF